MRVKVKESKIVKITLLMEEILHQLTGSLSHYLQLFFTSQVVRRISEPSTAEVGINLTRHADLQYQGIVGCTPTNAPLWEIPYISPIFSGYLWVIVITPKKDLPLGIFKCRIFSTPNWPKTSPSPCGLTPATIWLPPCSPSRPWRVGVEKKTWKGWEKDDIAIERSQKTRGFQNLENTMEIDITIAWNFCQFFLMFFHGRH